MERFCFSDTPRLTRALRAGDEEAFRWLHEQWNTRLFRYCFVLVRGDTTLAREVAQATYIRAFRHMRELPNGKALWNWLARAARNARSDLQRSGGRYDGAMARFREWFRWGGATPTAEEEESDLDALLEMLDRVLGSLPQEDLTLIEARYFEGTPLEDIGCRIGVSAKAVEGRLARVRKKIRELITNELQKGEPSNEPPRS